MSVPTPSFSLPEGDEGDTATVDVCIRLDDTQNGLLRELEYTVDVDLGNAGFSIQNEVYNACQGGLCIVQFIYM